MGAIVRLRDWLREKRSTSRDSHFWKRFDATLGLLTQAGVSVSAESALGHSPVSASARLLAETAASLPLHLYRRVERSGIETKELAKNHWLWPILHRRPNRYQTSYEFREQMMMDVLLTGNFFAQKVVTASGRIIELVPLPALCVTMTIDPSGAISYIYRPQVHISPFTTYVGLDDTRSEMTFSQDQVWHLKDLSRNTLTGLSRVAACKETIGTSMAVEKFGAQFFAAGAIPGSIAKHKGRLSEPARKNLKESISEFVQSKRHGTMLLEEGLEFEQLEISNEANQFLGTREFQVQDVARIWRVPGILIGHPDKTMTFASAEQQVSSFITFSLRSWLVRIEQSINANVIPPEDQDEFFVEHQMGGLLRGDMESRFRAYLLGRQGEWMSANEIRALENQNPRTDGGGDDYTNPNVKSSLARSEPAQQEAPNADSET